MPDEQVVIPPEGEPHPGIEPDASGEPHAATPEEVASPRPPIAPMGPVTAADAGPARASRPRTGAISWGIALVLIGTALLVSQFVPGVQVWRYWPLVIVAIGVRQTIGPVRARWSVRYLGEGLSTIAIGLVLLGQMIGYLQWNVWLNVLRLWPLLLVSLGLEMIGKAVRNEFVRMLGNLVIIAGLAYGALVMTQTAGAAFPFVAAAESEPFSLSASNDGDAQRGQATIEGGVGTLTVKGGSQLVTAEGTTPFDPTFDVVAGKRAEVRVGIGEGVWIPSEPDARLNVTLDEGVEWELEVNAGVSSYDIDLRDLKVGALVMSAGVSDGDLTLGKLEGDDPVTATIEAGVSLLTIRVPRDAAARVTVGGGLTGVDAVGEWDSSRDGDARIYESTGFTADGAYWDIRIAAGISRINVEYY